MCPYGAVEQYWDMRDLREALAELAERERTGEPNYPMCCLLLYAGARSPDVVVGEYVRDAYSYLDDLTGSDCLVFVSHVDGNGHAAIEAAKQLEVPLDSVPCCVFFAPGCDRVRAVVPIREFVTDAGADGLEVLMRSITQAARDAADVPAEERVARLCEILNHKAVLDRPLNTHGAAPANLTSKMSAGASIISALGGVVNLFGLA